ncbi:MAG: YqgE/AlgH family protein [Rhodococcus sp. (in: high G+C Gram-positive bacteria)]|uniref:YqgE/AlgH family protein n=1 Tax=Rhodococcus sp. TaxID=1831 RepID=UPI003BB7FFFD
MAQHQDEPDDRTAPETPHVRAGSLLVSGIDLAEPTFRRTVVYIVEHNESGSFGVVLNRLSDTAVGAVLPRWAPLATEPKALYVGGPVRRDSALCLGALRAGISADDVPGLRRVDGRVVMVDLDSDPQVVGPLVDGIRVFAGYAGWSAGQLNGELANNDWMVLSALPQDLLVPAGPDLWARVLRRQPLPLALLATHPIEVERN